MWERVFLGFERKTTTDVEKTLVLAGTERYGQWLEEIRCEAAVDDFAPPLEQGVYGTWGRGVNDASCGVRFM
jgi:hypothetical protein